MMVFSLRFGRPEEADHAVRIKGISGSTQAPFRQTGFLCPFCWRDAEQGDGSDPFIQALFWCPTPLLEQMIVVRSLPAFSLGLWHTHNSKMKAKETRRGIPFANSLILQVCYWKSLITTMICSEYRKIFSPSCCIGHRSSSLPGFVNPPRRGLQILAVRMTDPSQISWSADHALLF
jgi:hypothetical protein